MEKRQSVIDRRAKGEKERKGLEEREREANTNFSLRQIEKNSFKTGPSLASFSIIFSLLKQTNNTIFTTNQCKKMSCPSSIQRRDSNP